MRTKRTSEAGYTLVEIMIVVAIIGTVTAMGALVFTQFQNFYLQTTARNEIQRDARRELGAAGAHVETAPSDTPYGQREYGVRDSEGHRWWFATPRELEKEVWPTEDYELVTSHVETSLPEDDLFAGITP